MLTPAKHGKWTKTVLHTFTQGLQATDGSTPSRALIADKAGNVWGTTTTAGVNNTGTLFELIKPANKGGTWTYRSLLSLPVFVAGEDSYGGAASLAFDKTGNLFGVSTLYCTQSGCGSLFEVSKATLNGGSAPPKILLTFPTTLDGTLPTGLTIDPSGNLYGTSQGGGGNGSGPYYSGTVWEISPGTHGSGYRFQFIHAFCSDINQNNACVDGMAPYGGVTYANGALYGTAAAQGAGTVLTDPQTGQGFFEGGNGVIFSMTPPAQPGGTWTFNPLHQLLDDLTWQTPGPDYDVHTPLTAPLLNTSGKLILSTALGGAYMSNDIQGGILSVDPTSGNDSVVNNAFGIYSPAMTGPVLSQGDAISLDAKNRVYGNADVTIDASGQEYWGDIYMVTP